MPLGGPQRWYSHVVQKNACERAVKIFRSAPTALARNARAALLLVQRNRTITIKAAELDGKIAAAVAALNADPQSASVAASSSRATAKFSAPTASTLGAGLLGRRGNGRLRRPNRVLRCFGETERVALATQPVERCSRS